METVKTLLNWGAELSTDSHQRTRITATREGLATELGWHGNTYLAEFRGCEGE